MIVAVFLVLSALYHTATPPLEAPDEAGHVNIVLYLKEHRRLPVADRLEDALIVNQELVQPPLYYILGALITAPIDTANARAFFMPRPNAPSGRADIAGPKNSWIPGGDRSFPYRNTMLAIALLRLLSMLMGLGTVVGTYHVALAIKPGDVRAARFAAALVAFNPMFLFIANSVNNDNLATVLVTLCLLLVLRDLDRPLRLRRSVDLGILMGAAILAKLSALVVVPVVILGQLWRAPGRRALAALLVTSGCAVGVCGWWMLRNRLLYGDWLGLHNFQALSRMTRARVQPLALVREWSGFIKSYWGVFGAFNVIFPESVYRFFYLLTGVGIAGAVAVLVRGRSALPRGVVLLALLSLTNLIAVMYWTSRVWGSQGRLMFPAIASTAVLFAVGLGACGSQIRDRVAFVVSGALALLALYGAVVLIPSEY
jgi:4-amino-4-deoxy-L-arabinose transferase-like glycosyltransferase